MHECCSEASQPPELAGLVSGKCDNKFDNSSSYPFKWLQKKQPYKITSKNVDNSRNFFLLAWNKYAVKETR